jgi:hypothetical protein
LQGVRVGNKFFTFKKTLELSVTIVNQGAHLENPEGMLDTLHIMLKNRCQRGGFSIEEGGSVGHLHIQGCITLRGSTAATFTNELRSYLGFTADSSTGADVCTAMHIIALFLAQASSGRFTTTKSHCITSSVSPTIQGVSHAKNCASRDSTLSLE